MYLVYDEDAFLASPNGGLAAAPSAGSPRSGRPHVYRGRWTRVLAVTLAAATSAQLVASRVNHEEGSPSGRTDGHARTARDRSVRATTRPLGRRFAPSAAPLSASRAEADLPRQGASPPGAARPSGWRASTPKALARIVWPTAGTGTGAALLTGPTAPARGDPPGQPGTGAAREFGFEG